MRMHSNDTITTREKLLSVAGVLPSRSPQRYFRTHRHHYILDPSRRTGYVRRPSCCPFVRTRKHWTDRGAADLHSLERLGQSNLARLPRPVSSWRPTAVAWTGTSSQVASSVSHHLPPVGHQLFAAGQVARRLPGRHSSVTASPLRCRTGLLVRRRDSGRPPPWCPQGGLLPAGTCWTLWKVGGELTSPGPRGSRGHTCRTLPRAGSVSASRNVRSKGCARSGKLRPRGRPLTLRG